MIGISNFQGAGAVGAGGKSKETINNTKTHAYSVVNKFLAGFVDHVSILDKPWKSGFTN